MHSGFAPRATLRLIPLTGAQSHRGLGMSGADDILLIFSIDLLRSPFR